MKFVNRGCVIAALVVIAAAMWVLNFLTPEDIDDFWYKFIFVNSDVDTSRPIASFGDVLISQYAHWLFVNGRSVVHVLVQSFTGILGKQVFNICNAIVFTLFIYVVTRLCAKATLLNIFFVSTIVLLLFPVFGQTALWMTGSVNYLWTSTAVCILLLSIERLKDRPFETKHLLWALPCVLVGWMHEGITFPLAISLIVYAAINRRTICRQAIFPLIVGFVIGTVFCTFSPATLSRGGFDGGISIYQLLGKINSGLTVCFKLKAFWLLICMLLVLCYTKRGAAIQWLKEQYTDNIIICNGLLFSFGVIFSSGYMSARSGIGIELFSIILILRILSKLNIKYIDTIKIAICIGGGILYGCIVFWSIENHKDSESIIAKIKSGKSDIVIYEKREYPSLIEPYIVKMSNSFYYECIWNQMMAVTYNCERLAFVPGMIYEDIVSGSAKIWDITQQRDDYPFYVVPVPDDFDTDDLQPEFVLNPTDYDTLPFYIRPFANRFDRYAATRIPVATDYGVLDIDGRKYLFVDKHAMIDNRLKEIVLQ